MDRNGSAERLSPAIKKMKINIHNSICIVGIIASIGLGIMSLPSRFMATPAEAEAYEIMQEGLKQEIALGADQDDVVLMSHYAQRNIQELTIKTRVMFFAAPSFFLLFLLLLILNRKKEKANPTLSSEGAHSSEG